MIKPLRQVTLPRYIPFMLGSIFVLMAFDHALHAYAENYGNFWFFKDYKRAVIFDHFYLIDQSIIMPILFFCMGNIFIYQVKNYSAPQVVKKIIYNYVFPFLIGVLFIVPLLIYPRYSEYQDPNISPLEFYQTLYFDKFMQAGPFWVMYALTLYSLIAWIWLILSSSTLKVFIHKLFYTNILNAFTIIFIILLCSDLIWGAPWWIGFGKLFYLQGSRFITNFVFFISGIYWCLNYINLTDNHKKPRLKLVSYTLALIAVLSAIGYCYVCLNFEAYPPYINILRHQGLSFCDSFLFIKPFIKIVAIRIACLTILMITLFKLYHKIFTTYKFYNTKIWRSLSVCCYGLFIFHECITVWLQFYFVDSNLSPYIKVLIIFSVSVITSWFLTSQLIRFKIFRKILVLK